MRPITGDHEHRVPLAETHGLQRARVGPCPQLAIEMRIAKYARRPGRPRRREHHPAALAPNRLVHGRVGPVGRLFGGILRHFQLVDHRPLCREVVDGAQVCRNEAEAIEAAPIEVAVFVEERRHRSDLVILDRSDLVARGGIEPRRPIIRRSRSIGIVAMALDGFKPRPPRFSRAIRAMGHRFLPYRHSTCGFPSPHPMTPRVCGPHQFALRAVSLSRYRIAS